MKFHGAALLVVLALPAFAQINLGTVVVIGMSKDKVIIAADSRGTNGDGSHDDNQCKITALNDKIIFAAAGLVSDQSPIVPEVFRFDARAAAQKTVDDLRKNPEFANNVRTHTPLTYADVISQMWQWEFSARLASASQIQMDAWLKGSGNRTDSIDFIGAFAAADPGDGSLSVGIAVAECRKRATGQRCIPVFTKRPYQLSDKMEFAVFGVTDVGVEMLTGKTERAIQQGREWDRIAHENPDIADILKAVRIVDLTIAYSADNVLVGGAIDAVELNRGKGVMWHYRKPNCQ